MESIQDNQDRRVFELSLVMHLQFQTLICHRPFQNKVFKEWDTLWFYASLIYNLFMAILFLNSSEYRH